MLIQRFFLSILLFTTTLYSFSIFSKNEESKPIIIKPITIPKSVKEEDNNEILEKLKKRQKRPLIMQNYQKIKWQKRF